LYQVDRELLVESEFQVNPIIEYSAKETVVLILPAFSISNLTNNKLEQNSKGIILN
jgi:hypothetical protein